MNTERPEVRLLDVEGLAGFNAAAERILRRKYRHVRRLDPDEAEAMSEPDTTATPSSFPN